MFPNVRPFLLEYNFTGLRSHSPFELEKAILMNVGIFSV